MVEPETASSEGLRIDSLWESKFVISMFITNEQHLSLSNKQAKKKTTFIRYLFRY